MNPESEAGDMTAVALSAPASRYETPQLAEFTAAAVRAELTPAAVKAAIKLADEWGVNSERMCLLLGGISQSTWYAWKNSPPAELSIDQLTRVSYLLGIYTALRSLFRKPLANEWVSRPNSNALFAGQAPIDVMVSGGIIALAQVRAHLDGSRGGM